MCSNKWMQKFVAGVMVGAMTLSIGAVSAFAQSADTNNNLAPTPIDPIVVQNPEGEQTVEEVLGAMRPVAIGGMSEISEGYDAVPATEGQNVAAANLASDMNADTVLATSVVTAAGATQDAEGYYNFVMKVDGVKAGDEVVALVYADGEWVRVYPTVLGDGTLSFRTKVLGVISVIRVNGRDVASAGTVTGSGSSSGSGSVLGASRVGDAAGSEGAVLGATRTASVALGGEVLGAGRSPKTADSGNGLLILMAAACFAVAGGLVYTGKNRA